jgi:nucleotide-binding universal stress UspA family protein
VQRIPSAADRRARTAELALAAAAAANVQCEILPSEGEFTTLRAAVIYLAQLRDIAIVDVHGPLRPPRRYLVDDALFGSGRPLVLVPQNWCAYAADRVVVAWDAIRSAARAVHDALPLLRRAREVVVMTVIDDNTFWKPDTGVALCRHLAQWDVPARFDAVNRGHRGVGLSLLDHARHAHADLLVMGAFAHGIERELMLGSATRDIPSASL